MLHHSIVVGWAVTPTSLFALPGLFYWQLSVLDSGTESGAQLWCSTLAQNRALSSPRGKYSRCTVGAFRMCKGPKTCESLAPLQGNCNTRPICFISCAAWVSRCPKTNPFLPPTRCMEEGIRAERIFMDKFMADLEQFSEEAGGYGSRVWEVWKIGRVITQAIYQHSTPITRSLSPENYPLKCPHLVMLPLLGPLEPRSIRL